MFGVYLRLLKCFLELIVFNIFYFPDKGPAIPSLLLAHKTGTQRKSFLSSCSSLFQESSQFCDEGIEGQLVHSMEDQQGHTVESQLGHTLKDRLEHFVEGQNRHIASLSKELANRQELPNNETVFLHSTSTGTDLHVENRAGCSKQLSGSSENKRRLGENTICQKINSTQSFSYDSLTVSPTTRRMNFKAASFSVAENCDIKTKSKSNIKRTHSEAVGSDLDEENFQRAKRKHLGDGEFSLQSDGHEDGSVRV